MVPSLPVAPRGEQYVALCSNQTAQDYDARSVCVVKIGQRAYCSGILEEQEQSAVCCGQGLEIVHTATTSVSVLLCTLASSMVTPKNRYKYFTHRRVAAQRNVHGSVVHRAGRGAAKFLEEFC